MGDNRRFWELCSLGDIEGVQAAMDNGADVNEEDSIGATGLMCALNQSHNNVVQMLLQHPQIDVNRVATSIGYSTLHWAVQTNNHEGTKFLLGHDDLTSGSINHKDCWGQYPIMCAVHHNSLKCFHLLLTNPLVDLHTRDDHVRTAQEVRR